MERNIVFNIFAYEPHPDRAPPYTAGPHRHGVLVDVLAIAVDSSDNVWVGADGNLYRFKKPSYSGDRIARSMLFTNPQAIVALPTGKIAVTAVKDNSNGFAAGAVDIFTPKRGKFVLHKIKAVPYPESLILDRKKDLIVTSCSSCFSQGQTEDEVALIAPPYTKQRSRRTNHHGAVALKSCKGR